MIDGAAERQYKSPVIYLGESYILEEERGSHWWAFRLPFRKVVAYIAQIRCDNMVTILSMPMTACADFDQRSAFLGATSV